MELTLERAKEINRNMVTEDHLIIHSLSVCCAMEAMAKHFGADAGHWMAVGYLHNYDYEKYPDEHLHHTEKELLREGVDPADVRKASGSRGLRMLFSAEPSFFHIN